MSAPRIALEDRVLGKLIVEQVERSAERVYLSYQQRRWTYAEFFAESQALAKGLKKAGVRPQEPVILMMNNRPEFMVAYWALAFLNAIVVPVNAGLKGDSLAYILRDIGARAVLVEADLAGNVTALDQDVLAKIEVLAVVGGEQIQPGERHSAGTHRVTSYAELIDIGSAAGTLCEPAHFDDLHLIPYTSGTTGPSKGVMVPYAQTIHTSLACIDAVGIEREDIIYAPLPLFHGMSRSMGTIPALLAGAQAHLSQRFSASRFWQEVADAKATVAVTIFTIPPTLKAFPPTPLDRSHGLRVMFNAHHDREFEERFGVQIVEAHGMTELGLTVYSPYPERRDGAAGRAAPEWEVRVVDGFDRDVPTGEAGEMVVRPRLSSIMMKGYWNKPAETTAAQRNLWFHTGDFMRMDNDGFLYFDGRKKERIRCRGENVSAYEVETVVAQHPDVLECAVVAYPAGDGEDEVRLVAIVAEGATLTGAQLGEWLETRLAKFMLPRYIEFQTSLPKTATGKVEKFRIMETGLPDMHWDRRANMARSPAAGANAETFTADSKP
ncbi:AMP-binding protein [Paraburkholderia sp. RP-4-7]|uniref:AMP-binding protein n=1 Tax=Paraburkholderia polaris TaxID=2728848 RepID=A0A848IV11_9BURK|nr:AMP-binding protein [Paraburkholderia polaris]NMM03895.1 AMP-binding protein [Paraburkholderia polaris]